MGTARTAEALLAALNERQREAVVHGDGPLLVLAGAGSGKTRVIAHRVAYLLATGRAEPGGIVAVTFTNRAADEMRDRIGDLLGGLPEGLQVRTFHSLCLRILRREAGALEYPPGFVVYDEADQIALVRECLQAVPEAKEVWSPRQVLARIGTAKTRAVGPEEYPARFPGDRSPDFARVYAEYQRRLRRAGAMDFDDLIGNALLLFETRDAIGRRYAEACRHLLVDEYQDTNRPQHLLVKRLSGVWGNVCVVGDEDQSIYSFRGADVGNILRFAEDFPGARTVKLERNYRSTRRILAAAAAVVSRNRDRIGKTLWTEGDAGEPLELFLAPTEREEALWAVDRIRGWRAGGEEGEFALLYRTNAQSRPLEEALNRVGIPYRMVGGIRFYGRREVKDLIAYLRLLIDPADDLSLDRVLNVPPRGIGETARRAIRAIRDRDGVPLSEALDRCLREGGIPPRARRPLESFRDLLAGLRQSLPGLRPTETLREVLARTAYVDHLHATCPEAEAEDRAGNVDELLSGLAAFDGVEDGLQRFLDETSLLGETDLSAGSGPTVLMTLHSAKGLEFAAVLLTGCEEGLLPHGRSVDSDADLEEERRLFYVGLTRAKRRVFLSCAGRRRARGVPEARRPSRFLAEIPRDLFRDGAEPEAGILAGSSGEEDSACDPEPMGSAFTLGQRVRHPTLGVGTVIGKEGGGENLKLTISFPGSRARKILLRYTRLRPVTPGGSP